MEQTGGDGKPREFPPDYVDINAADGVVLDKVLVERDHRWPCITKTRSKRTTIF